MPAGAHGAAPGGGEAPGGVHRVVNPEGLAPPVGFAHAVVAAPGRTVYLGGQAAQGADGQIVGTTLIEQFDRAAGNLAAALAELGGAYRRHLGRHYVATALFEVAGLFDPAAKVELVGIAVVPDREEQP